MTELENLLADVKFRMLCIHNDIEKLKAKYEESQMWKMDLELRVEKEKLDHDRQRKEP